MNIKCSKIIVNRTIAPLGLVAILVSFFFGTSFTSKIVFDQGYDEYTAPGIVVLELFTSQGCSSCPPADELLRKIKQSKKDHVFTIAYHVDYWNYIGWEDPFSKPEFTIKQTEYNRKFENRSNYTPQLVVNGKEHFVGSNARKLYENIALYGSLTAENQLQITDVKRDSRKVLLEYSIDGSLNDKRLRAVLILDERITKVKRGENTNRSLTNSNIAVAEARRSIDSPTGNIQLILPDLLRPDDKIYAILIIENKDMDIVGAARSEVLWDDD